jgi:hypothetical protein
MTGVNPQHVLDNWIKPAVSSLGGKYNSRVAALLVLGTGAQESNYKYVTQLGGGPGLGFWQMEPATHADIYKNFLFYRPNLLFRVIELTLVFWSDFDGNTLLTETERKYFCNEFPHWADKELTWNQRYAAAMCRIHYYRVPDPLPTPTEGVAGLARYWKCHYNTEQGAGTEEQFIENWNRLIKGRVAELW